MKKLLFALILAAVLAAPVPVHAQASLYWPPWVNGETAAINLTALSTETPIVLKWVGGAGGGTATVAAGGNITLSTGPVGGSTADATVTCGGGGNGVIVVANAACDTLGEVVDKINASPNWRAWIVDGLRSDSSNDTLATLAESAGVTGFDGLGLIYDAAVGFKATKLVNPERSIRTVIDGARNQQFARNPYVGQRTNVWKLTETTTFGSGTSTIEVWSCIDDLGIAATSSTSGTTGGTETCTALESVAGGATTVEKSVEWTYGLFGAKGARVVVRVNNSAAMTAAKLYAFGIAYRYRQPGF